MLDVTPTKAVLWEYGFDWLDRLVTVKRAEAVDVVSLPASPLGPTALQRSYVFDESDNRTFFDDHVNDVTYYYKYKSIDDNGTTRYSDQLEEILIYENAAGHRIVGDFDSFESLEHDLDGNLTQRTITSTGEEISYQWTALDRLKRVESSANGRMQDARYDVHGLRERKLASGALTQFKNGNSSVEYGVGISTAASGPGATNSAAPSVSYISGHMIMGAEIDGEFVYHLGDALSTVRDVVDHTGTVIKSFEFDEYGNLLSLSGSGATSPKTWIGGLSVNDDRADSGMFNMGHRNYAAGVLGRFISRDPIGHAGNLNLYAYPTNPVRFADPSGLEVLPLSIYAKDAKRQAELREKYGVNDFNCFRHAVGESIQGTNPIEDYGDKNNILIPNPNLPYSSRWNSHPYNELQQHYDFLPPGSPYKVGDTVIYGRDNNQNGSIDWDLYTQGNKLGSDLEHAAIVSKVTREGAISRCTSKGGQTGPIYNHDLNDPKVRELYGNVVGVFRLKAGANPGRIWR